MSPKEKATEMYENHLDFFIKASNYPHLPMVDYYAKNSALMAVEEILPIVEGYEEALSAAQTSYYYDFWLEVKKEIEKI